MRYGENDIVILYYLFLIEWLISDSNRNGEFFVSKKKGYEVFCDFYFKLIVDGGKFLLLRYIIILV